MMFGFGPAFAEMIRPDDAAGYHLTPRDIARAEQRRSIKQQQHTASNDDHDDDEEDVNPDWARVFALLDQADGRADGLIDRHALLKWVSALDLQNAIEFEADLNIGPRDLERLVSKADQNKDGFVDRREFLRLVANRDKELSRRQQSLLRQYLRVAAYADEYSCWPPPLFIPCLTVLQVAVYAYHAVHFSTHPDHADVGVSWTGPEPACSQLVYHPRRRQEPWRFLTYCLAHAGAQHLLLNMLMQLFVGLPLEASHGAARVALVYLSGVLAGSLGTSALDPGVFLAGASGGVYALIAAHLATLVLNWREDIVIMRRRFRSGKATSAKHGHIVRILRLTTVLLYSAIDTGAAVYGRHVSNNSRTSYVAHLGGAVAGLLVGIVALKNRKVERWERRLKAICVVAFLFLLVLAVAWNVVGNNVASITYGGNATYFQDEGHGGGAEKCHNYI